MDHVYNLKLYVFRDSWFLYDFMWQVWYGEAWMQIVVMTKKKIYSGGIVKIRWKTPLMKIYCKVFH